MTQNGLKINFIGNFEANYVGEVADETHLVRELESLGCTVYKVPRDIWKAMCDGEWNDDWKDRTPHNDVDINIMCKWHHFDKEKYVNHLRNYSGAPVFYWTWDHMDYNSDGFHYITAKSADLLLTNDGFNRVPSEINWHYFPFDVADGDIARLVADKQYDVTFFGSHLRQGDRIEWIKEINKTHPVTIFSWNHEEWKKEGIENAFPAVYGKEFSCALARSKIVLGFNVNDHTPGYWSNRVGKVLTLGGFLLQRYVPGMELSIGTGAEFFSSVEEANEKIEYYLAHGKERAIIQMNALVAGRRFTSRARISQLIILIERFLNGAFD